MWEPVTSFLPRNVRCERECLVYNTPLFSGASVQDGKLSSPHLGNTRTPPLLLYRVYTCVFNMNRAGVFHNDLGNLSNVLIDLPRNDFAIVDYEFTHVDAAIQLPLGFSSYAESYVSAFYGSTVTPSEHWGQCGVWVSPAPAMWDVHMLHRRTCPRPRTVGSYIWNTQQSSVGPVKHVPKARKRPAPITMPSDDDVDILASFGGSGEAVSVGRRSVRVFHSDGDLTFVRPLRRLAGSYGRFDPEEFVCAYKQRVEDVRARLDSSEFYYLF